MIDFTDIDKNLPNGENMGGLLQKVYFGYHSDVSSFPTKPVNPTALELASVLTGELVMKAGKETSATQRGFPGIPVQDYQCLHLHRKCSAH